MDVQWRCVWQQDCQAVLTPQRAAHLASNCAKSVQVSRSGNLLFRNLGLSQGVRQKGCLYRLHQCSRCTSIIISAFVAASTCIMGASTGWTADNERTCVPCRPVSCSGSSWCEDGTTATCVAPSSTRENLRSGCRCQQPTIPTALHRHTVEDNDNRIEDVDQECLPDK